MMTDHSFFSNLVPVERSILIFYINRRFRPATVAFDGQPPRS
jgi:hypothetical protein